MSEQQRLLIAIALSIIIISGWQMLMSKLAPPIEESEAPALITPKSVGAQSQASDSSASVKSSDNVLSISEKGEIPAVSSAVQVPESRFELISEVMNSEFSNKNGVELTSLELRQFKERLKEDVDPETGNPILPGLVSLLAGTESDRQWQGRLSWELAGVSKPEFVGTQVGNKLQFKSVNTPQISAEVEIEARPEGYGFNYVVTIVNNGLENASVGLTMEIGAENTVEDPGFGASDVSLQGICGLSEEIERKALGDLEDGPWVSNQPASWAGIDLQYFVLALIGRDTSKAFSGPCKLSAEGSVLTLAQNLVKQNIGPGEKAEFGFTFFVGPKRDEQLMAVSEKLTDIVDYDFIGIPLGFLARPMVFLLNLFHQH